MNSKRWTGFDITDRLKDLFAETPKTPLQKAYLEAASVLSWFSPHSLNPVGGTGRSEEVQETILNDVDPGSSAQLAVPLDQPTNSQDRYALAPQTRREILKQLFDEGRIQEALAANPQREQDAIQRALDAYLGGYAKPLEGQKLPELQATLQVSNWLEDLDLPVKVPALAEVQARIEWESFLQPFRDLVGDEFAGRESEMDTLADYVGIFGPTTVSESAQRLYERIFSIRERPPLLILGPGGMGKSTLVAQFVLTHAAAQYVQRFPFAYLDFDRPGLLVEEPITLLLEAARQMAIQYPRAKSGAEDLRKSWTERVRQDAAADSTSRSPNFQNFSSNLKWKSKTLALTNEAAPQRSRAPFRVKDRDWFYEGFANFVNSIKVEGRPVLLVLDTFEEVQFRSRAYVEDLFDFLDAVQKRLPELRTVLAGRAPIKSTRYKPRVMQLPPFDIAAAQAFLRKQGVDDSGLAFKIAEQVGGAPLTLKLAARLLRVAANEAGPDGIRNLETGFIASVLGDSIQAQLYYRILDHIHDEEVRKLANPGLILRRITPELILQVLAKPCSISVHDLSAAREIFNRLAEEISLVESDELGVLVHRPDVRAVMLGLLKKSDAKRSRQISDMAISYYSQFSDTTSRGEELYHLLLFDFDRLHVQERLDYGALASVLHSINELPDRSQAFLAAVADVEREERIWNKADLEDWESHAAREANEFLSLQKPKEALDVLSQRAQRTASSPLYLVEIDALMAISDFTNALKKAENLATVARNLRSDSLLLDALARQYEALRGCMAVSNERTRLLTAVVLAVRELGSHEFDSRVPLDRFFASQRPGDRIVGISLAQASPRVEYLPMALETIQRALSAFEQFHGMVLAENLIAVMDRSQALNLTMALKRQERVQITKADMSRWNLRERMLARLEEQGGEMIKK